MTYTVEKYAADGCGGPDDAYLIASGVKSLQEARAIVRRHLGVRRLTSSRRWYPDGDVEAYHDFPASHPRADGCGGVSIHRRRRLSLNEMKRYYHTTHTPTHRTQNEHHIQG